MSLRPTPAGARRSGRRTSWPGCGSRRRPTTTTPARGPTPSARAHQERYGRPQGPAALGLGAVADRPGGERQPAQAGEHRGLPPGQAGRGPGQHHPPGPDGIVVAPRPVPQPGHHQAEREADHRRVEHGPVHQDHGRERHGHHRGGGHPGLEAHPAPQPVEQGQRHHGGDPGRGPARPRVVPGDDLGQGGGHHDGRGVGGVAGAVLAATAQARLDRAQVTQGAGVGRPHGGVDAVVGVAEAGGDPTGGQDQEGGGGQGHHHQGGDLAAGADRPGLHGRHPTGGDVHDRGSDPPRWAGDPTTTGRHDPRRPGQLPVQGRRRSGHLRGQGQEPPLAPVELLPEPAEPASPAPPRWWPPPSRSSGSRSATTSKR